MARSRRRAWGRSHHREDDLRLWGVVLWLAACRAVEGPAEATPRCPGSDPPPVPGFSAYRYAEVRAPDGTVHATNWAWQPARTVTLDVDVASFPLDAEGVLDAVDRAIATWNAAGGVALALGGTGACCADDPTEDCRACGEDDGVVELAFAEAPDEAGLPAYTRSAYGDDPATADVEPACLVDAEVRFFPGGRAASGEAVTYAWVADGAEVVDVDPSDGVVEKPLHDTLVHELGHVLGLGDQDDPSVACSVMAHCADPACGCDFEAMTPVDRAALAEVYGGGLDK